MSHQAVRTVGLCLHAQGIQLIKACEEGALPVVRTLTPRLYPPRSKLSYGLSPPELLLETAARHKHASVLKYLLANLPVPWNSEPFNKRCPIISCSEDYISEELIHEAVSSGCPSVVQVLLDAGMDINHEVISDYPPYQPICIAVREGKSEMVKFLLEKGADPNERDIMEDLTVLASAAEKSSEDIMLALSEHGAEISGSGALIVAAMEGHISAANLLLGRGADVNEILNLQFISIYGLDYERGDCFKERSSTALHMAARYGQIEMVKLLLKNGAKEHVLDWKSDFPVHKAKQGGHTE